MTPRDDDRRLDSPPLQGRGRGWGVSANTIALLHDRAAAMRRDPTEPEKRLWRYLSRSQLGGFKFRRQAAIGSMIVDFLCPSVALVVELDGHTHADPAVDARRDAVMANLGYRVVRFTNTDVMTNIDGVLQHLLGLLQAMPARRRPTPTPPLKGRGLKDDHA